MKKINRIMVQGNRLIYTLDNEIELRSMIQTEEILTEKEKIELSEIKLLDNTYPGIKGHYEKGNFIGAVIQWKKYKKSRLSMEKALRRMNANV